MRVRVVERAPSAPSPCTRGEGGERVHFRYRRQAREPNESARVVPYGSPHAPMKRKRRKSTRRAKPTRLPLLHYENVAAARRRAFRKHLSATLLALVAAKLLVHHLGERVWTGAQSLFWQERCLAYRLPEDRLAYVAAPQGTVLPAYLGDFSGGVGSTWHGTVGAAPYPVELAEFQKVTAP